MKRLFAVIRARGPALLIMRAADSAEIAERLAADPWTQSGLLVVKQIVPWQLRLGTLA